MSENEESQNKPGTNPSQGKDSFNVPVKKSPLFLFAMLQIPLVIFMVVMMYFLYQSQKG